MTYMYSYGGRDWRRHWRTPDVRVYICISIFMHIRRKASWNPEGVEPVHWKSADIHPGSLNSGTTRKVR